MFYTNRILSEYKYKKENDHHLKWIHGLIDMMKSLNEYILDNHGDGFKWAVGKPLGSVKYMYLNCK